MTNFRTDFGTDIGPACSCKVGNVEGEGIWGYQIMGDQTIKARCVLCGHEESFKEPTVCKGDLTVKDIREVHEQDRKITAWYGAKGA